MDTDLNAGGSYIHTDSNETVIHGPSGEIRVSSGVHSGDTLSPDLAQSIVDGSDGQFKIEDDGNDKYLVGPDGFKRKIGDKLTAGDIAALQKAVPNLVKGGTSITGPSSPGAGGNAKSGNDKPPAAGGPDAAPGPVPANPTST
jgi:hypothetical protein